MLFKPNKPPKRLNHGYHGVLYFEKLRLGLESKRDHYSHKRIKTTNDDHLLNNLNIKLIKYKERYQEGKK